MIDYMKSTIALFITALFLVGTLAAQTGSPQMSALASLFENTTISSLHVYAHRGEQIPTGHPLAGQLIPTDLHGLFQGEFRHMLESGAQVYATQRFQSGQISYFIVRASAGSGQGLMNAFHLFRADAQGLQPVLMLSLATCARGICAQQDAWIESLPGGAGLGIFTKSQRVSDSAEVLSQRGQWMLQEPNGAFRMATGEEAESLPAEDAYELKDLN